MSLKTQRRAADQLTHRVMRSLRTRNRQEVACPQEQSPDDLCVMRDASEACTTEGLCHGCGQKPSVLLNQLRQR